MKKQDKIIAIVGVSLIIILAIIAIVLLFNSNIYESGIVNVKPKTETVELQMDTTNQNDIVEDTISETSSSNGDENVADVKTDDATKMKKSSKKSNQLPEKYTKSTLKQVRNDDSQLAELAGYWEEYSLDAVADLIRLERIRLYTDELKGTNQFYYYGEVDGSKVPNGRGLAIYSDNTYYYGDWSKGLREGQGMWLRIYPDEPGTEGIYTDILEHQYNGEFKDDLPNGEGQEHYTYGDADIDDYQDGEIIINVIGSFKNGYYDGDVYMMTRASKEKYFDFYATAKNGVFKYCEENTVSTNNKRPVWREGGENNGDNSGDDGYHWMLDEHNKNFGIYGLKK